MRSLDSLQKSCRQLISFDCDYITHVHSDAWYLEEQPIYNLISRMEDKQKPLAVRGSGLEFINAPTQFTANSSFGHVDDHFFFIDRLFAKEHHIFNFKPECLFPHKYSTHGMLMAVFAIKAGLDNIWYYRKLNQCLNYSGALEAKGRIKPSSYDPIWKFLHLHRGSFPTEKIGCSMQAMYLEMHNLGKHSDLVHKFISTYSTDYNKLLQELKQLDELQSKKLKRRLYLKSAYEDNHRFVFKDMILQKYRFPTSIIKNMFARLMLHYRTSLDKRLYGKMPEDIAEFYKNEQNFSNMEHIDKSWLDIYKE